MKTTMVLLFAAALAACSTPGISYSGRLVPENTAAVETRSVDVGRFDGPAGNWYASRFEQMISSALFDGRPWFRIARYSDGYVPQNERAGIYEGTIDIEDYFAEEYGETTSECVEWDGPFDCERRVDVEQICLRETVKVSATPRLIEYGSGRLLFQNTYFGEATSESCEENYYLSRRGRRSGAGWDYGMRAGVQPPHGLVQDALASTLQQVRNDIAPRNATMKATFLDEASDPVVAADPRFKQALKAAKNDPGVSCAMWRDLRVAYPQAPAVTHNLGACLESSRDFLGAHSLYAEAADQSVALNGAVNPDIARSLSRLSAYRRGLEVLDRLLGQPARS
ncbi:hypothetical protein [Henriciella litoralis]|uniref:hypothetical protein n=1 Tax=Henriciella litoralis TaxID=568102 RepID=UPI000A05EC77|nr:hypothetical protein [Henriciella litoralis]